MTEAKRYTANPVVSLGDEGDEGAVLFNPDTDDVTLINPTGKLIWNFILAPKTKGEIAAHLQNSFSGVSSEQALEDTEKFLEDLMPDFIREA